MRVIIENHLGIRDYHCSRVELWKLQYGGKVLRLYDYVGKDDYSLKLSIGLDEIKSASFIGDDKEEGNV